MPIGRLAGGAVAALVAAAAAVAPATTSRKMSWLRTRARSDSSENGFDADDGSAATRKNLPANAGYGSIAATPVVIAECGFLSNYEEAEKLTTKDYQKQVAHALCSGILAYLEASGG